MVVITFSDKETQKKALGFLLGRYSGKVLKNGEHIVPEGWNAWPGDAMFENKEKTAFYAEYQNVGPGSATSKRVPWSKQLTAKQAKRYTVKNIFDGWLWASSVIGISKEV